ncbi:hypothetical protein FKP32DRAFT_1595090 [Trametes sanguinea]|nr:hypothetical protein FKP32DRAFT_1595090 [Trametes sanguinea]
MVASSGDRGLLPSTRRTRFRAPARPVSISVCGSTTHAVLLAGTAYVGGRLATGVRERRRLARAEVLRACVRQGLIASF